MSETEFDFFSTYVVKHSALVLVGSSQIWTPDNIRIPKTHNGVQWSLRKWKWSGAGVMNYGLYALLDLFLQVSS